jgi:hypothetical protein
MKKDCWMAMQALFKRLGGIRPLVGDKFIPMAEFEIAAFEEQIGARLPEAYRHFLATYGSSTFNGISPDNPYIQFRPLNSLPSHVSVSGKGLFDAFYGGATDERDPYSLQVRTRFLSGRMPETMIPIGDDGGAGQICIGVKGEEAGKIYYWDQANEPVDEEDYLDDYGRPRPRQSFFQNVNQIAVSFEDFLRRLEVKSD